MRLGQLALLISCGATLWACTTPESVRELTDLTAANVANYEAELERFEQRRREIDARRVARIIDLETTISQLEASRGFIVENTQFAGPGNPSQLLERLRSASDRKISSDEERAARLAKLRADLEAAQRRAAVPSEQLMETAKALAALNREAGLSEQFRYLRKYGEAVKEAADDVRKKAEKDRKAGNAAEAR